MNKPPESNSFSDEQISNRRKTIGASEIGRIMDGKWLEVYEQKLNLVPPIDLSTVFVVQLGIQTEPFNIAWRMSSDPEYFTESDRRLNQGPVNKQSLATYTHPKYKFLSATPDAWCTVHDEPGVMDCKHTNPNTWGKIKYDTPEDRVLDTYKWQMQQQMMCTDTKVSIISPIYGNVIGDAIIYHEDKALQKQIVKESSAFWEHVKLKLPPLDSSGVKTEKLKVDTYRSIDEEEVDASNYGSEWNDLSKVWLDTIKSKKENESATKQLKKIVPDDARSVTANGIRISRSKNDALKISPT